MRRTKGSRSEVGMLYQYGVTTLLAAELSENSRVDDYVIYSSEKSAGKFDDVVARIKLKDEEDWHLSLIQVKYKETKKLNVSDNLKGKRIERFLSDYIQCFNEILDNPGLTCRRGIPSDNVRFAIFCDRGIQMPVFLRQDCTFQLKVCPYCEKNNTAVLPFDDRCWKFVCKDLEDSEHQLFFDRCRLFLEQPNHNQLNKRIQKICAISSAKDIINYVKDFFNDDYLYKQGLSKEVFEIELERMRLFDAIPPLIAFEDLADDAPVTIWNEITLNNDITAVNYMEDFMIESTLYSCLMHQLNILLNINIDWKTHISKRRDIDDDVITKFITHSKTKRFRYWIDPPHTLQLLIMELWKCGDLPLILRGRFNLTDFERYAHLKRSYIIIDDWTNQSNKVSASKLNIFTCLNSIRNLDLQEMVLKNTLISLQGRDPITLKELSTDDDELMSTFTCADLLRMMRRKTPYLREDYFKGSNYLVFVIEDDRCTEISERIEPYAIGHNITMSYPPNKLDECLKIIRGHPDIFRNYTIYRLRRVGEKLVLIEGDSYKLRHLFTDQYGDPLFISHENEFFSIIGQTIKLNELQYIHRKLRRVTLPRSFFSFPKTQICLLSGDLDTVKHNLELTDVDDINETISTDKRTYFVKIDEKEGRQYYWRQFCQLGYPILDVCVKDGRFDLLRFQHCKDLGLDISYEGGKCTEDEFLNEIRNEVDEIIVVTGDAGIGKTSLLKWLCNNYSTGDYIIFYDLINLQVDLSKCQYQKINPIDFIFENIRKSVPKKYVAIVSSLLRRKRLVWVLDSFDEIRLACEQQVLNFISLIAQSDGTQIIIATRTENSHALMNQFGVRLIKIEPLEEKERSLYWELNEDLLENVSSELATNPLYLNFLKIISVNREQLSNITKFTLYQKVVNMKIRRCLHTTYRIVYDSEVERIMWQFERLALVTMFGKETIARELYWIVDNEVYDMSKFGIITGFDENANPIFYHRSFVEFLVAQWIAKAHRINIYKNTCRCLYKQIFRENKLHVLNILTEDVELHKTVLQTDLFKIGEITKTDPNCWDIVDKLGRTALHAAVINCRWVNRLSAAYRMLEFVVTSMLKSGRHDMSRCDEIMDWNWSEYVEDEVFEFACVYQKMEVIKIYLHLHRKKIEEHNYPTSVFPTKYFNMLFRTAIKFNSIDMIADLAFLQNLDNKIFCNFYQTCLGVRVGRGAPSKDIRFEGQLTLMHIACIYGSISMMRNLIGLGLDVNAIDTFTYTPLYYCILRCSLLYRSENIKNDEINRNLDAVKFILEAGGIVDPWILPTNEMSPLCLAVQTGNVQVVRILLATGADICRRCVDEDTPLHLAARAGYADIVECLLDHKAPQFLENDRGETAIDIAIKQDHKEVIDLLRTRRDVANDTPDTDTQETCAGETNRDVGFGGTPLHDAVCSGDLNLIDVLLSEGWDVNIRNSNGFTLLHAALNQNDAQLVRFLLSKGVAVDVQDKYGCTPLFIAVGNDNRPIIDMILENGADPNIPNMFTITPLYSAVADRNLNTVKLLLEKGANVNVQRVDGITPLYESARNGDVDVAALLLENGADTEIPDEYDATPLHLSILERHREISELLLRNGANPNVPSKEGHTPLYLATFREDVDMVRLLLEKGASVNDEDTDGVTPLHVAAKFGNETIVRLLLEKGANVNAKTLTGESVLFLATLADEETDIVALLLEANVDIDRAGGANALGLLIVKGDITALKLLVSRGVLGGVNAWDEHGHTPLHLAAEKGHAVIVDYLLEQGARMNAKSLMGYTSLHHAIRDKQEHIVKLLIDKGANINTESGMCRTAFILAIDKRNVNIVKILLQADKVNIDYDAAVATLKFSCCMGDVSIIKLLLDKNIKMDISGEYGYTLLYIATVNGDADIVKILLENLTVTEEIVASLKALRHDDIEVTRILLDRGASVDVLIGGNTPLHLKVAEGNANFVKLLIEKGADVNLRNEEGKSPLEIAVDYRHTDIVGILLKGGVDVNARTSSGDNILRLAARKRNVIVVELLLNEGTSMIVDEANTTTILHECARESNIDILNLLLERNSDLNMQDNIGNTALHIAVIERNLDVVSLLSSHGRANAYVTNYNGRSSFHLAICKRCTNAVRSNIEDDASHEIEMNEDNVDVIWSLLDNMKVVDVDNDDVRETFYWAAEQGRSEIVRLLLHRGMNIDIQDQYGYTALHLAANNNHREIVEMLLEQGADVQLTSNSGVTPLDSARSRGYEDIVDIIRN